MAKSTKRKSKAKIGRPKSTGAGTPMVVRMHAPQIKAIDNWIEENHPAMSRPEAIRRLVEEALAPPPPVTRKIPVSFFGRR